MNTNKIEAMYLTHLIYKHFKGLKAINEQKYLEKIFKDYEKYFKEIKKQ